MSIIYDLIFLLFFALVYLPVYFFKRKFHAGFRMRFGVMPGNLNLGSPVWIHAVSVGEAMAVRNLVKVLRGFSPGKRLFITTVTATGNKIARSITRDGDYVAYFPLDLSFIVRRVVEKIRPSIFIITETEIWPNLISCLYQRQVPIILVNGRLSDRSFKGYLMIKFLIKPALDKINFFCVQTENDARRFFSLGVSRDKIRVTGNMKFDNAGYQEDKFTDSADKYRRLLELKPEEKLWVCGSTHPGEEEIILDAYKELTAEFPRLKLLIAPRHPERKGEVERIVSRRMLRAACISALEGKPCNCISRCVYILDTVGELLNFYNIADIVFVGGSLVKKGGHNILEPASLGKPVITGPYTFNFRDIAGLFLENGACIIARDKDELSANIKELLRDSGRAGQLSRNAGRIIAQNQGATARNLEEIKRYLQGGK